MENLTPRQRDLLERLARFDSKVEVRWDEARGVAASIRGTLAEPEKPQTTARTVQQFLVAQGDLFGPPGVVRSLKPLRPPQRDDLGWTRFEFQQYYQGGRGAPIEVYGAQLTAHVTREGILREVQSSCWREVVVETRPRVKATALRRRLAAPQAPGYRDLEMRMKGRGERTFPLMQPPRLVIYFWQDRFRLAWTTYSYAPAPVDPDAHGSPGLVLGQVFVDAVTGEVFLFSPTGMRAESPVVGSGLGVTRDSGGGLVVRQLNVVRVDATSTHRLRDTTHARDIITYDLACALGWKDITSMAGAVSGAQPPLPVSENATGSDWSRVFTAGTGPVLRMDSQQPEVDAHFFVQRVYEWYFALSGGRAGWDADGAYPTSTVPAALPIRVATHVYPQIKVNAGFDAGIIGTRWYPFLMFWDGNPTAQCSTPGDRAVDYVAGLSQVVAHEYQHGITAFSFIDGGNNPGLGYVGWAAAVHEGLSDVFGCLFSDVWTGGPEISSAGLVFRNAAFPRDATSWENRPGPLPCGWGHHNKDHFADRVSIPATLNGEQYDNGAILAHAAFLMASGGVHQRASRSPALIPVSALAGETVNGHDFSRATRIWYRALTTYLATYVKGVTNRASLDEEMFRQIRYGCVSAAEDLYGTGSVEQQSTALAFYAVGLHPVAASYGADVTCMPWAAAWRRSRPYLGGIYGGCPDAASVDLFVNNDGVTSEWNALVNVLDSSGNPTHYENTVYCRVRNVGDLPAQNIVVSFSYAKVSPAAVTWLPVVNKNGVAQTLVLPSLNAGESSFPDSSQSAPPASGSVKWDIPPLTPGETIDHFCLRATLACADVNLFNNDVQSNIVYAAYTAGVPLKLRFHLTNPFKRKIRANLSVTAEVPPGWQARLTGESGDVDLEPGAQVEREIVIDMPAGADARLVPPLDGVVQAELHGPLSGLCLGALSDTRLEGSKLTGRLAIELPSVGSVHGGFAGTVDLATGAFQGVVLAALQNAATGETQPAGVGLTGRLRPWRRVHVEQTVDGERVGGFSIQVQGATPGDLDAAAMPGTATRVPRG
jgi:Zn-dependent metalloprotease